MDVIVTRTNREEKKSVYEFLEETLQIDLSSVYGGVFGHQVTVDRKDKKNFLEIKTKQVELSLDEIREEENAFIERLTSKKIEEISKGITNDEKERLLSYFRQRLNEYKVYKLKYEVRNDIRSLDDNYIKEYELLWKDIESSGFAPEIQMYFSIHEKEYEKSLNYKYYAELLQDLENKLGHFERSSTEYNLRKIIKLCNEVENVIRGIEKVTKEVIADQRKLEKWMYEYDEKYLALSIDKIIENASSSEEMVNEYAKKMLMYFLCEKMERIFASEIYEIADSGENNREQEKKTERLINKVKKDIEPYQDLSEVTALFTHAYNIYGLKSNPCKRVKKIGKSDSPSLNFWTKAEYDQFLATLDEKDKYRCLFQLLFWTGIREGECLALCKKDIDFVNNVINIDKTYFRSDGKDVITTPKTENSVRKVYMPDFLAKELKQYLDRLYEWPDDERIFPVVAEAVQHKFKRNIAKAGVKKSQVSLSQGYFWDSLLSDCLR